MAKYVFQQSNIWDANVEPDKNMPLVTIKMPLHKGEKEAAAKLPKPEMGRQWLLISK